MHRSSTLVALAATGLFAFTTSVVTAETITVCASGCDHTSMISAVLAAADGDVIQLSAETYVLNVPIQIDPTTVTAITIQGVTDANGDPVSILDGGGFTRVIDCQNTGDGNIAFENLVIQNGSASDAGGGMAISRSTATLTNCWLRDNEVAFVGGAIVVTDADLTLNRCILTNNAAEAGPAIYLDGGSLTLFGCQIRCNASDSYPITGPWTDGGCNCVLRDCESCTPFDDADGDGVCDETDACPDFDDTLDSDLDGTPDCLDACPGDPLKTDPGLCGCGIVDTPGAGDWDLDCDGDFDADDTRLAMKRYGIIEASGCPGDVNGDGNVDAADLGLLIAAWGACP